MRYSRSSRPNWLNPSPCERAGANDGCWLNDGCLLNGVMGQVRGEFHWWGWNSALGIYPQEDLVNISFCRAGASPASVLVDVRTRGAIDPLTIQNLTLSLQGRFGQRRLSAADLGADGCKPVTLIRGVTYSVQLNTSGYYTVRAFTCTRACVHADGRAVARASACLYVCVARPCDLCLCGSMLGEAS